MDCMQKHGLKLSALFLNLLLQFMRRVTAVYEKDTKELLKGNSRRQLISSDQ
jgi:hypothetical protein